MKITNEQLDKGLTRRCEKCGKRKPVGMYVVGFGDLDKEQYWCEDCVKKHKIVLQNVIELDEEGKIL